ncbi:hypothetical protein K469DRAFT_687681 [Zopfia rhizophila CBS 207.26]|uniref:Heterokaryon incompatibility domain-containing protein n=1 Tax=Zopfia rhizophila CBS 207.26 TaxID=1314779 RepID=A0A6A6E6P3_9PEZI|nr:hypothetical protein K469DRAFT_687681 [Zopfia rhizophila CBS 207.26]
MPDCGQSTLCLVDNVKEAANEAQQGKEKRLQAVDGGHRGTNVESQAVWMRDGCELQRRIYKSRQRKRDQHEPDLAAAPAVALRQYAGSDERGDVQDDNRNSDTSLNTMDHLWNPSCSSPKAARVPYLENERYDGGPFMGYAQRKIRMRLTSNGRKPEEQTYPLYTQIENLCNQLPPFELSAFFQSWLFFGLLAECFGCAQARFPDSDDLVKSVGLATSWVYERFIGVDKYGNFITTKELPLLIQEFWVLSSSNLGRENIIAKCTHLADCLALVNTVLPLLRQHSDQNVWFSIAAVAETLVYPIFYHRKRLKAGLLAPFSWADGYLDNVDVRRRMLESGWCPTDIVKIKGRFSSWQSLYLLSLSQKTRPISGRNHAICKETECMVSQMDPKNYPLRHVEETCRCGLLGVRNEDLVAALNQQDCIPLLKFSGETAGDLTIDVVESSASMPYIAISHVWIDGLGNPKQNALYRCQLLRLKKLVVALHEQPSTTSRKSSEKNGSPPLLIWLDTLCCPITPMEAKIKAIERIRNVYSEADRVLVLDSSLQMHSVDGWNRNRIPNLNNVYPAELLLRIFTCTWTRRLWTLQEGALAPCLYFQFSDTAVSFEELFYGFLQISDSSSCFQGFELDIFSENGYLRSFFSNYGPNSPISEQLSNVDQGLMYRSVSVPSDEALCIGTLLSLDLAQITAISPQDEKIKQRERMKKVWELIAKEKVEFRSTSYSRFVTSVLSPSAGDQESDSARLARWYDRELATLHPNGLRVTLPGFRLTKQVAQTTIPVGEMESQNALRELFIRLIFRDATSGIWYHIATEPPSKEASNHKIRHLILQGNCAVVVKNVPSPEPPNDTLLPYEDSGYDFGLLVSIICDLQEHVSIRPALKAQFEHPVLLRTLTPLEVALYSKPEQLSLGRANNPDSRAITVTRDPLDPEHDETFEPVESRANGIIEEARMQDINIKRAIVETPGQTYATSAHKFLGEWYNKYQGSVGERLPEDQVCRCTGCIVASVVFDDCSAGEYEATQMVEGRMICRMDPGASVLSPGQLAVVAAEAGRKMANQHPGQVVLPSPGKIILEKEKKLNEVEEEDSKGKECMGQLVMEAPDKVRELRRKKKEKEVRKKPSNMDVKHFIDVRSGGLMM